ncbi:hypothetical protein GL177_20400 [Vibrio toranzoniae]|uniref:hypothetical protein n=1 Tax=Vibrio toranzoniae TaxID=1194427 RepID=UPI000372CE9F|nr:hypothetical protein [Vibrio toranzoniae]NAZ55662.1 hypothetical protein [Vibrio toranzoniae]OED76742.1 hypothetical protein OAS_00665 [Vibrio cyclitrophicus ZF65]
MTCTSTKIKCTDCQEDFFGVLHDLFDVSNSYSAECPRCKSVNFFYGVAAFVGDIPVDAVEIKYVAKL